MIHKSLILIALLVFYANASQSQSSNSLLKIAMIIDSVQGIFYQSAADRNASLQVDRNGMITEIDSTFGFEYTVDIGELDLEQASLVQLDEFNAIGLYLPCKQLLRCVAYRQFGKRFRYMTYTHAMADDQGRKHALQQQLNLLERLQILLSEQ